MQIFVTGTTGFVGRYFAQAVVAQRAKLIALVRPTSDTTHLQRLGATLRVGDLQDEPSLTRGMQGCEAVVHIASPKGGWKQPGVYETLLLGGTQNVLQAMQHNNIKRLLYLSTVSVHGLDPLQSKPISEEDGFGHRFLPYDYYSKAKVIAERMVQEAHAAGHIKATVVRPGWVYGPYDKASYQRLADWMVKGIAVRIGSGRNRVPLVYAGNVADFMWAALMKETTNYQAYLYAYDGHATQNDYLASLMRATKTSRSPLYVPKRPLITAVTLLENLSRYANYRFRAALTRYYVHLVGSDWHFNQQKMVQQLGYQPTVGYEEGFAKTEAWYHR